MKLFDKPGKANTEECARLAAERAKELGLKEVVIATNVGDTVSIAQKYFKDIDGIKIIAVTHHCGLKEPWVCEMPDDVREKFTSEGVIVLTTSHALSGAERSFRRKYQGIYPLEIAADTLRLFGQGTKVCVEVALMAADAGLLSGKEIMTLGGTGKGADTAIVLSPTNQRDFLDMKIHEIICKPRL